MKKNKKNFEEWLEASLAVADSIYKTATPHTADFIRATAEKLILTEAIEMYRKEANEQ